MLTDRSTLRPGFDPIMFDDEHQSDCDLDTHCPTCGRFYTRRPLVVAVGTILFMLAYSLRTGPASQAAAISAVLFIILGFFFASVLRNRRYELGILFSSAAAVFILFFAARPMAMFPGTPPPSIVVLGILGLFVTIVLAGKEGISDSSALTDYDPGSFLVILIVAANVFLSFGIWTAGFVSDATSLRLDTWLPLLTERLSLIRWISAALIGFVVVGYAFVSASREKMEWDEVQPATRGLPERGLVQRALVANSNVLVTLRAAAQNGWRSVGEFFKETGRAIGRLLTLSVARFGAVAVSLARHALVLVALTILAVFCVTLAVEIAILWQQESMFLPLLIFWPQAIVLTALVVALATLLGGLSFKRWSARPVAGSGVPTLFAKAVGDTEELNTALRSLMFSAVWFVFYTSVSLWGAWLAVNVLTAVQENAVPTTLGLGFITGTVLLTFLLLRLRPRRQARPPRKVTDSAPRAFLARD